MPTYSISQSTQDLEEQDTLLESEQDYSFEVSAENDRQLDQGDISNVDVELHSQPKLGSTPSAQSKHFTASLFTHRIYGGGSGSWEDAKAQQLTKASHQSSLSSRLRSPSMSDNIDSSRASSFSDAHSEEEEEEEGSSNAGKVAIRHNKHLQFVDIPVRATALPEPDRTEQQRRKRGTVADDAEYHGESQESGNEDDSSTDKISQSPLRARSTRSSSVTTRASSQLSSVNDSPSCNTRSKDAISNLRTTRLRPRKPGQSFASLLSDSSDVEVEREESVATEEEDDTSGTPIAMSVRSRRDNSSRLNHRLPSPRRGGSAGAKAETYMAAAEESNEEETQKQSQRMPKKKAMRGSRPATQTSLSILESPLSSKGSTQGVTGRTGASSASKDENIDHFGGEDGAHWAADIFSDPDTDHREDSVVTPAMKRQRTSGSSSESTPNLDVIPQPPQIGSSKTSMSSRRERVAAGSSDTARGVTSGSMSPASRKPAVVTNTRLSFVYRSQTKGSFNADLNDNPDGRSTADTHASNVARTSGGEAGLTMDASGNDEGYRKDIDRLQSLWIEHNVKWPLLDRSGSEAFVGEPYSANFVFGTAVPLPRGVV
ncbi:hypothetical protein EDD11_005168 [Mortierella claussenii]|nr:hypothetical protein EDD11_005168 [Mortierella claussenii]